MMVDAKPSLFIVGHPKTGTTALHAFLSEHPSVCMSRPKEPWFFCSDFHWQSDEYHGRPLFFRFRDEARYLRVFSHAGSEPVVGEASAVYLHSLTSAAEIARFNPEAKIVILLREPVAFLRALHKEFLRNAMEDEPDFATAISKDEDRRRGRHLPVAVPCPGWSLYCDWVDYARQVGRFFDEFGRSSVQVLLSEDFRSDNPAVYKQVARFIGVDDGFAPEFPTAQRPRDGHSVVDRPTSFQSAPPLDLAAHPPVSYLQPRHRHRETVWVERRHRRQRDSRPSR